MATNTASKPRGKLGKILIGILVIYFVYTAFLNKVNVPGSFSNTLVNGIGRTLQGVSLPTQQPGVPMVDPNQMPQNMPVDQTQPGQQVGVEYLPLEEVGYIKSIITKTRLAELRKAEGGKYDTLWMMDRGAHVEVPVLGRCYKVKPGQTVNGAVALALGINAKDVSKKMYEDALISAGNGKKITIQPGFIFVIGSRFRNVDYGIAKVLTPNNATAQQMQIMKSLEAGVPIAQDGAGTKLIFYKITPQDTSMEVIFEKVSGEVPERHIIRRALAAANQSMYMPRAGDVIIFKLMARKATPDGPAGSTPRGVNPDLNPEDLTKLL